MAFDDSDSGDDDDDDDTLLCHIGSDCHMLRNVNITLTMNNAVRRNSRSTVPQAFKSSSNSPTLPNFVPAPDLFGAFGSWIVVGDRQSSTHSLEPNMINVNESFRLFMKSPHPYLFSFSKTSWISHDRRTVHLEHSCTSTLGLGPLETDDWDGVLKKYDAFDGKPNHADRKT